MFEPLPDPADAPPEEDLPEVDYADPLKRDPEEDGMPGLDPIVSPIPPD